MILTDLFKRKIPFFYLCARRMYTVQYVKFTYQDPNLQAEVWKYRKQTYPEITCMDASFIKCSELIAHCKSLKIISEISLLRIVYRPTDTV